MFLSQFYSVNRRSIFYANKFFVNDYMKGDVMVFKIKILFVTMICALSIIGCKGTGKHFVKWPLENIKEWPPKNAETDNMLVGVNVKDEKIVFGPSWEKVSEEEFESHIHQKNTKVLYTVYVEEINNEDPAPRCRRYKVCGGGMCVNMYLPPGCKR